MGLNDILYDALQSVNGTYLAGVVSTDGLGVELLVADDMPFEPQDINDELTMLVSSASIVAGRLGGGATRDIIVEADELSFLASQVAPGYYAVIAIASSGNLGRARFAVHQMVSRLQTEL